MTPDRAPCGCPWDGIACPHCGKGENADHIRRHHQTATGYPILCGYTETRQETKA